MVSLFDLSRTLPVHGGLLVPCSLPGPPVIKQLMQLLWCLARVGGFSPGASPNITDKEPLVSLTLTMEGCLCLLFEGKTSLVNFWQC